MANWYHNPLLWVFRFAANWLYLKNCTTDGASPQTHIFGLKLENMTSLWRHLRPTYRMLIIFLWSTCVKLMWVRVLKVWWRYLHYFGRYCQKTRGGQKKPPSKSRVKSCWPGPWTEVKFWVLPNEIKIGTFWAAWKGETRRCQNYRCLPWVKSY